MNDDERTRTALLDAIFVHAPFSVALYDRAGRVAIANAAYERHFGIRVADIPPAFSLLTDPQLEAAGLLPLIRRAYDGEHVLLPPVRYDAAVATGGQGHARWTQGHCYPVRDGSGTVTHIAIVHADVLKLLPIRKTKSFTLSPAPAPVTSTITPLIPRL